MFGIGGFELFLILLFGFLIFGPDKLPAIAKTVGQAIAKFRDAQAEMTEQLKLDELLKATGGKGAQGAAGDKAGAGAQAQKAPASKSAAAASKSAAASAAATQAPAAAEAPAADAADDAPAGGATKEGGHEAPEAPRLSFSERKARYEAQRAAQAAAAKEGGSAEGGDA